MSLEANMTLVMVETAAMNCRTARADFKTEIIRAVEVLQALGVHGAQTRVAEAAGVRRTYVQRLYANRDKA